MAYHVDSYDGSIVIDGFDKGIADDPFSGIADMRNVNVVSIPGEASVGFQPTNLAIASLTSTFTSANTGTDVITSSASLNTLISGVAVTISNSTFGGVANGVYWLEITGTTTAKLHLKPDLNDTAVDITSSGTANYSTIDMGKPLNKTWDKTNNKYYIIDTNGRVWSDVISAQFTFMGNTTLTAGGGNGLVWYRGYIFAFRDHFIDYMSTSTFAWTYGWQVLLSPNASGFGNSHQALVGQDDTVYYCDGQAVGSFFQKTGTTFDPSNATTYTWNQTALALPSIDTAQCLAELGTNLMVGGQLNAIYPWDRIATSFKYPVLLGENFIAKMVTINTTMYILAGNRGRVYYTSGAQAQLYKKIPDHISGAPEPTYTWGDIAYNRNQLYIGFIAKTNNGATLSSSIAYGGVWAIDMDSKALRLTTKLSYNTYAGLATLLLPIYVNPTLGYANGYGMYIGWDSGASTYGIDGFANANPYTASQATIDTDIIAIGTYNKPRNLERIEYRLSTPMVNGESVQIQYRLNLTGGWTTIFTDTATSTYLPFSNSKPLNFKNVQWIQFRAILNSTATTPSYVRLKEIRITGIKQ